MFAFQAGAFQTDAFQIGSSIAAGAAAAVEWIIRVGRRRRGR